VNEGGEGGEGDVVGEFAGRLKGGEEVEVGLGVYVGGGDDEERFIL